MKSKNYLKAIVFLLVLSSGFHKIPAFAQTGTVFLVLASHCTEFCINVNLNFNISLSQKVNHITLGVTSDGGSTFINFLNSFPIVKTHSTAPVNNKDIFWDGLCIFHNPFTTKT